MKAVEDLRKKVKPAKGEWPYVILGVVLFFGSIFLFVAEIDDYEFTIDLKQLRIISAIAGLLLAIALSIYYGKGTKGVERIRLTLLFVVFLTLIVPVWTHLINRLIPIHTQTKTLEVFENSLNTTPASIPSIESIKEDGFFIFLVEEKGLIKLHTRNPELMKLKAGEFMTVEIKRGLFGFRFLERDSFE